MLIFFNPVAVLTGIVFQFWKRRFDYAAVMKDVFSVDKSCILLSKCNQMLSICSSGQMLGKYLSLPCHGKHSSQHLQSATEGN